jgi:hypothetical protein
VGSGWKRRGRQWKLFSHVVLNEVHKLAEIVPHYYSSPKPHVAPLLRLVANPYYQTPYPMTVAIATDLAPSLRLNFLSRSICMS